MKKLLALLFMAASLSQTGLLAAEDSETAEQLAQAVWKASGGMNWPKVKAIDFTFAVEKGGQNLISADHHWDVAAQTDQVKWKGKDVMVNLADPASDEDGKAGYARWVNDSYWLIAPLKLKDHGVHVVKEANKMMDGAECEVLHLSFDQIGLTPKDQYRFYINPTTKLLASWDYMPEPGKSMHGTWDDYQESGGLTLATDHKMDGGARIRILNLKVTAAQ